MESRTTNTPLGILDIDYWGLTLAEDAELLDAQTGEITISS